MYIILWIKKSQGRFNDLAVLIYYEVFTELCIKKYDWGVKGQPAGMKFLLCVFEDCGQEWGSLSFKFANLYANITISMGIPARIRQEKAL